MDQGSSRFRSGGGGRHDGFVSRTRLNVAMIKPKTTPKTRNNGATCNHSSSQIPTRTGSTSSSEIVVIRAVHSHAKANGERSSRCSVTAGTGSLASRTSFDSKPTTVLWHSFAVNDPLGNDLRAALDWLDSQASTNTLKEGFNSTVSRFFATLSLLVFSRDIPHNMICSNSLHPRHPEVSSLENSQDHCKSPLNSLQSKLKVFPALPGLRRVPAYGGKHTAAASECRTSQ